MNFTIKGVKLAGFDHELADSVGLYSVLDVEMRSSGSAAAIQEAIHISDEEEVDDAVPSTPRLDVITGGAESTPPLAIGDGAIPSTPMCSSVGVGAEPSTLTGSAYATPAVINAPVFTSSSISPIAPAIIEVLHPIAPDNKHSEGQVVLSSTPGELKQRTNPAMISNTLEELTCMMHWLQQGGQQQRAIAAASNVQADDDGTGSKQDVTPTAVTLKALTSKSTATSAIAKTSINKKFAGGSMKIATRKDAPTMKPIKRGSLDKALSSGAVENRARTLANFKRDIVAASGVGPRRSHWRTWCRLHATGWATRSRCSRLQYGRLLLSHRN